MSFRTKTILLLIVLGLTPYVITMMLLLNVYRTDLESRLLSDMKFQLDRTIEQLDQQLHNLDNDLHFIASLDIMNDVLSGDLDKRIYALLELKKQDLQMEGEFVVVDTNNVVVASTNLDLLQQVYKGPRFSVVPLFSTFSDEKIGELLVDYHISNLRRNLPVDEQLRYQLLDTDNNVASVDTALVLRVDGELLRRPGYWVHLEQDRAFAFAALDNLTRGFYLALMIGVCLIAGIAYVVANYILNPILALSSTARNITRTQDFSQRVSVARTDEIGQLSISFNSMIDGVQDMLARLNEESENKLQLAQEKNRAETLQVLSTKLSKYLSPQIYESIFSGETDVTLTSSRKKLTIFFSDIVGFTSTSDEMESEDLTVLLNQYLREMTEIALQYGATIDKYIGDAIMIFFGDPHSLGIEEDAKQCVAMSIAMQKRVKELQNEWRMAGFTRPFEIRIGIHTGYCTVGNFGTENRMDYTIIGSAVNLANRIENAAEPGQIYISEETWLLIKRGYHCDQVASIPLKGILKQVDLYRVSMAELESSLYELNDRGVQFNVNPDDLDAETLAKVEELLRGKRSG